MAISELNRAVYAQTGYGNYKAKKGTSENNFINHMVDMANSGGTVKSTNGSSGNIVLHGVFGETDSEGYTVVGAWGDAQNGTSSTVYKPPGFDKNNPVYRVKIWDAQGNMTQRDVKLDEVDPTGCDSFDLYAYSCYLSHSGKCPSAMQKFMGVHAHYTAEEGFGKNSYRDMFAKVDWTLVVKSLMDMQYRCGNIKGYWDYKNFYDGLIS